LRPDLNEEKVARPHRSEGFFSRFDNRGKRTIKSQGEKGREREGKV